MNARIELTVTQRIVGLAVMFSAFESLQRKGIVDFDPNHNVVLKVPASEAFRIGVSPTTDAPETLVLYLALGLLLMEKGSPRDVYDFDRAIYLSLQNGRLATVPWPLPELPQLEPEPELEARVLERLIALEKEGRI